MFFFGLLFLINSVFGKYLEGEINTSENWAFLARFCFLSEEGQFEYHIEFNEEQGFPNLLLYYDSDDQWPAVYKSNKTCADRERVLNVSLNQIVNLTVISSYHKEFSGCSYTPLQPTTPVPHYTLGILPQKQITKTTTSTTTTSTTTTEFSTSTFSDYDFSTSTLSTDYYSSTFTSDYFENETEATEVTKSRPKRYVKGYYGRKPRDVVCRNARKFRSSRERWWFIAISNCNGTKGIHLKYKLLMTNGYPGDYWHEHFSADEFYILPVLMAFSIAYSFLMLGIVMCSIELKSRQLLHTTYKIFVLSVVLQLFGILFQSVVYLKYAVNGIGSTKIKRLGAVLMGGSETTFLLLLLLLAKGFTVTRGRLPLPASIKLTIFMCLYVVTYISIFIYEAQVFDPGEVLYLYESPAGYSLIILRIIAWCMFIYSTVFTLKRYPEKSNFYYPFNVFGTLWFIAGPAFILSANTYIDKWVRESVVCAVLLFITFGGHLMFLILTMPSVANKNFPYHVRTTQIGVMELSGGNITTNIEEFGHHVYEPSVREQTVIVPLTRRTEEIFEGMYNPAFRLKTAQADQINQEDDIAMDNVLKWSLARNVAAIELPQFDRFGSTRSNSSKFSQSTNNNETNSQIQNNFDDYVKDVPIELFTISRMVVTNSNPNTTDKV